MDSSRNDFDDLLLDLHLERVTDEQRAWLRDELDRNPELAQRNHRLGRALAPLDLWSATAATGDPAERVMQFIRGQSRVPATTAAESPRRLVIPGGSWFRLREMIAAAACVGLLVGVVIPGLSNVRAQSRRAQCAGNLSALFSATSAYQQTFADSLPYAGYVPGSTWLASNASDRVYASNSRHLFTLLRGAFGAKPSNFLCPSDDRGVPLTGCDVESTEDFVDACNVSYDSLNLAAVAPNLRPMPIVAYLSDPNPLFERARFKANVDPDTTNSRLHKGCGQNVLTLDGRVRWITTPCYGPRKDNIWLAGNIRTYTGCETPTSEDDVQLIPGYPAEACAERATDR